jgi:hypothetical protein
MIIPFTGNVKFPLTLDASVWIFDERRIKFEEAFTENGTINPAEVKEKSFSSDERFNREVVMASNDNKPIPRKDADEILESTYLIEFKPFFQKAEVKEDAASATLVQDNGEETIISLDQLENSYFLFSKNGKPLREDGPVHIYFGDGSNKDEPIKSVKKIVIN